VSKRPDRPIVGGADDPELAERIADLQEKARNRARAPWDAAFGTIIGKAVVLLVYALVAVLLLAAFVGLYRAAEWLWGLL